LIGLIFSLICNLDGTFVAEVTLFPNLTIWALLASVRKFSALLAVEALLGLNSLFAPNTVDRLSNTVWVFNPSHFISAVAADFNFHHLVLRWLMNNRFGGCAISAVITILPVLAVALPFIVDDILFTSRTVEESSFEINFALNTFGSSISVMIFGD